MYQEMGKFGRLGTSHGGLVMRAYSLDLRSRVLADCDAGHSNDEVARKYRVSAAWIRRLKQRRRETGSIEPRVHRVPPPRLTAYADRLQELVEQRPDATLEELRQALGVPASLPSFCRALQRLRLTVKKKSSKRRNRIGRM
jgi:transposase